MKKILQVAVLVDGPEDDSAMNKLPWFLLETTFTTDGLRTRICNGRWGSREEALAELKRREEM
jgi:hypothetical protein